MAQKSLVRLVAHGAHLLRHGRVNQARTASVIIQCKMWPACARITAASTPWTEGAGRFHRWRYGLGKKSGVIMSIRLYIYTGGRVSVGLLRVLLHRKELLFQSHSATYRSQRTTFATGDTTPSDTRALVTRDNHQTERPLYRTLLS